MAQQYALEGGGAFFCLSRKECERVSKLKDGAPLRDVLSQIPSSRGTINFEIMPEHLDEMLVLFELAQLRIIAMSGDGFALLTPQGSNWVPPLG